MENLLEMSAEAYCKSALFEPKAKVKECCIPYKVGSVSKVGITL